MAKHNKGILKWLKESRICFSIRILFDEKEIVQYSKYRSVRNIEILKIIL